MATINAAEIRKIVVACDAGMGSSVMLASQLRKQLRKAGVTVEHSPVASVPADADVIVCHAGLADRVRSGNPDKPIVAVQVFLGDPAVTRLVAAVKDRGSIDV